MGETMASPDAGKTGSVPEPLKIPPSRARRQLQARLDAKKEKEPDRHDPDVEDAAAVETATHLPNEPDDLDDNLGAGDPQSPEGPLTGRRNSQKGRRPSTTEAKERQPLSDEDEDVAAAEQMEQLRINETRGSFTYPDDDSSDDDMVEIRPRRTS
ncbi:hypothetical protein D0868_03341 [Hortaea werneckii]|uniref:Uncharacterized protein n=1 Tax=Hortaea werneckii TaxID=91943 RepID=A0A3M6Z7K9_HORWE|nr:hypothetical protein D0868_03341 [Hortaea werneckii]RMY34830.1 hypothetical protein D0866_05006 [Hortaea werneckii]